MDSRTTNHDGTVFHTRRNAYRFKGMTRSVSASIASAVFVVTCLSASSAQKLQILESRADGSVLLGQHDTTFTTTPLSAKTIRIDLDETVHFQRMDGFGASLTDSSASLLLQLPAEQRTDLMHEIFSPSGPLGLTLLRQPIGASDFSAHGDYSYDDPPNAKPDPSLAHFSTAMDDKTLFPLLREALHLDPQLRLLILPWSAPAWMKDSHTMRAGALEDADIPVYAQYLARTVGAYAQQGLPVYALALQNEPLNENPSYPTQRMDPNQEVQLAAALQPLLLKDGRDPLLLGYEHNWSNLDYPSKLLAAAAQHMAAGKHPLFSGISFHCYVGDESAQLAFLRDHPTTSLWFTECSGTSRTQFADDLMWNARHLLLGAPLNGARSVILWNLVLNPHGGPHNGGCDDCRGLFTADMRNGVWSIHRNVEYYILAHAASFVHPGATRIAATAKDSAGMNHDLQTVAFQNPDGTFVLLLLNATPHEVRFAVESLGQGASYTAPARSLLTLQWGTPVAVLSDGAYRIALDRASTRCLEAVPGESAFRVVPPSSDFSAGSREIWTLHRLGDGRFEIRNVATSQSLGVTRLRRAGDASL